LDRTSHEQDIGGGLVADIIDPPLASGIVTVISPPLISADLRAPHEPVALLGALPGAVPCEKAG
jgi:hypothetical protein